MNLPSETHGTLNGQRVVTIPLSRYQNLTSAADRGRLLDTSLIRKRLGLSCREKCGAGDQSCVCDRNIRGALS